MADDPRGVVSASWGDSSKDSFISAKKHFDIFLANEVSNTVDGKSTAFLLFGTETPARPSYETSQKHLIDAKLMKRFAKYLADSAMLLNDKIHKIEFLSASRYLNAIQRDLLDEQASLLNRDNMKIARKELACLFRKRANLFRGGWMLGAMEGIFDYLYAHVTVNPIQRGVGGIYGGGVPPVPDPLTGDEPADLFPTQ